MHLPKLWNLSISVTYSHYAMELPWSRRSKDVFATFFYSNYTEQQCREVVHAQQRASFPKFSGAGCFVVMQPSWSSCGRTNQWNTKKAIQYFSTDRTRGLQSSFCTDRCYPMERAGDATYLVNATRFLSVLEAETSLNFRFQTMLAMSTSHSKLDILGINTGYQPREGFSLSTRMRPPIEETFRAAAFGDGIEVVSLGWGTGPGGTSFSLQIKDSLAFLNALSLDLAVFSKDLDCSVVEVQAANATLETIAMGSEVCDPMIEVCENGWKPVSSFRLPLQTVRKDFQDSKALHTFDVQARTSCASLIGMEDQSNSKMRISFNLSESGVTLIPYVPGQVFQWTFKPCTFDPVENRYRCSLTITQWKAVRRDGAEFFLTAMLEDHCSLRWPDEGGEPPTVKELCGQADFGETKLCGGTRESTTWRLPMAKVDTYEDWEYPFHEFSCRLSCTRLRDESNLVILMEHDK